MASQIITPLNRGSLMFPGTSAAVETSSQVAMPLRVIVAEDDAASRHLLQHFLKQWGFDSDVASNGNQAWDMLQSKDVPTIAIFDWVMPGLEGVELCRKVRRLTRQHYTYVLLLTSKTGKQDVIEGLGAGADDYVSKPFNPKELQARLLVAQRIIGFQEPGSRCFGGKTLRWRKVRAPADRVPGNTWGARAHGKCNREQTAQVPRGTGKGETVR